MSRSRVAKEISMEFIKDILLMGKERDMGHSNGTTGKNSKEIGNRE